MPDFASAASYRAIAKRAIQSVPESTLDPEAVDRKGSTVNILVAAGAAMATEAETRAAAKIRALTLDTDVDEELDAVVADRTYGEIVRFGATPAVVPVQLRRASGAYPAGSVPAGARLVAGSVAFTLDEAVPFLLNERGPIETTATATAAGAGTNIAKGAIAGFDAPQSLFDPLLTVANLEAAAGGGDRELNTSLRSRARAFPAGVQRATSRALEVGAMSVAGVRQAVLVEPLDAEGYPSGSVLLYIADANGQANSALVAKVVRALLDWRAAGVPVRVVGSVPTFVEVRLSIGYLSGFATSTVQARVRAAIVNAINALRPSDPLYVSALISAARTVPGVVVPDGAVLLPVGTLYASNGETYRTTVSMVTFA